MKATFERQNDEIAMTYLRAARYCSRTKLAITYYMIIVSVLTTAISIAIKYLKLPEIYSTLILLFSGLVLISNIFCGYLKHLFNLDNVNLLERYDIYVFDMPANKALLKPLAEQTIVNYASKIKSKKTIERLKFRYFKTREEAEVKHLYINHAKNQLAYEHRLMINVRVFFMLIWLAFMIFLAAVAFIIDNAFTDTVINIFIPSLSAISLIVSSWIAFSEQIKRLTNANNVIKDIVSTGEKKDAAGPSLSSQVMVRSVQDAVFSLRLNSFTIPELLVHRFDKMLHRDAALVKEDMATPELKLSAGTSATRARAKSAKTATKTANSAVSDTKKTDKPAAIAEKNGGRNGEAVAKNADTIADKSDVKSAEKATDKATDKSAKESLAATPAAKNNSNSAASVKSLANTAVNNANNTGGAAKSPSTNNAASTANNTGGNANKAGNGGSEKSKNLVNSASSTKNLTVKPKATKPQTPPTTTKK